MLRRADDLLSGPLTRATPDPRPRAVALPYGRTVARPWPPHAHLWALLAVTVFGGLLRFYRLTYPVLWNDETLVYWRVCGTYGQLLGPLKTDGFPPLHYSLYWLLGHPVPIPKDVTAIVLRYAARLAWTAAATVGAVVVVRRQDRWVRVLAPVGVAALVYTGLAAVAAHTTPGLLWPDRLVPGPRTLKLTPWVMRSIPALCGTLTVPAMYFLARQLFPIGTSLVASLLTACSAFMLFYSRDAKMYPDAWLLIVLNVGCLLWWCRTGLSTAYLGWIAAGAGAVGLHPSAYAVPALTVVFFLTQRSFRWPRTVLFVVGLAVIYSGIAVYFTKFNLWNERVEEIGWQASGLPWVGGFYNGERTGPDLVGYAATAFLAGYEWPRVPYLPQIIPSLREVPKAICWDVLGVLAVTLLPWPLVRAIVRPDRQRARDRAAPEPPWRVWLWLGTWLALPTYFTYCHSIKDFSGPRRWLWEIDDAVNPAVWAVALGGFAALCVWAIWCRPLRPIVRRTVAFWLTTAALFGGCCGVFAYAWPTSVDLILGDRAWQSLWEPRYLGFMWPAVGLGVAALLMRLPTRPVRVAAVAFFCLANLFIASMRMVLQTEPPIDRMAADVWAAQDEPGHPATARTYDNCTYGGIAVAQTNLGVQSTKIAGGRYFLQMLSDRPQMSPNLFERSLNTYVLRQGLPPPAVGYDVRHAPATVDRVVCWDQLFPGQELVGDPYRRSLPPGWRLAHEDVYPIRVIWDWRQYWTWVRREYVRTGRPTP